jgi:hypothetical protein
LVGQWLNQHPDVTAKSLFHRLQDETPESFAPGSKLRTLQRRVKERRGEIARPLMLGTDVHLKKKSELPQHPFT